jgi:NADH-quinone oxidoreductase subunit L
MHHEQDMRRMGGLKKYMPITFATMMTGWLAICGIPIFAGFFSKDEILWKTWSMHSPSIPPIWGKALWVIGAITAGLTAVYMTRLMVMTFWGSERFREANVHATDPATATHHDDHDDDHARHGEMIEPHESPWTMTVPLVVLAILSTVGGLVGVPYALSGGKISNYFEQTLEPVVAKFPARAPNLEDTGQAKEPLFISPPAQRIDGAPPVTSLESSSLETAGEPTHEPEEVLSERIFTGVSIIIALAGIGIGWITFKKRPLLQMPSLLENKYYVDEIYDTAIINPINVGSREGLWKLFDLSVIDGIVNTLGRSVAQIGAIARYLQTGFVRSYAAVILFGALLVVAYFAYMFVLNR